VKIQCNCGAKYAFDVTPDLLANPIKLVCPSCGLDLSDSINQLVQRELAQNPPPVPKPVSIPVPVPIPASASMPAPAPAPSALGQQLVAPPSPTGSRLRIGTHQPAQTAQAEGEAPAEARSGPSICLKHGGKPYIERCVVCQKPICEKCMQEFGYLCSAYCKTKAENNSIAVPVFEGQKTRVEARYWRKVGLITTAVSLVVIGLVALWTWYCWVGALPRVRYAVKLPEAASGQSAIPEKNQLVFLHGDTLARHDVGSKKEIWSHSINESTGSNAAEESFGDFGDQPQLLVRGHNIWVEFANKVVRYDWDSGKPVQEILDKAPYGDALANGDEAQLVGFEPKKYSITHVNLVSGESHVDEVNAVATPALTLSVGPQDLQVTGPSSRTLNSMNALSKGMDTTALEQRIQSLPLPARIALPAVIATSYSQEQALNEINEDEGAPTSHPGGADAQVTVRDQITFLPTDNGQLQVRIRLLQKNIVARAATKAPPKKSALDGTVNQSSTAAVENEILNEMRHNSGEDVVYENESRYQIVMHRLDATNTPDWKSEMIGPPSVYPLQTVNVVAANKTVFVLDKMNKLLWAVTNTFNMAGDHASLDPANAPFGLGPVTEKNGTLYVADQGVLTAFELSTGNARWRIPTVGVMGIIFDDEGMMYVNTTSANPDSITYSKQIDVTRKTEPVVMKIDPATGKTLWTAQPHSFVSYTSGKYLYTVQMSEGGSLPGTLGAVAGAAYETHSTFGLRRLNPKTGAVIWQYFQQRFPLDVKFDKNTIQVIFSDEVQVLHYLTF